MKPGLVPFDTVLRALGPHPAQLLGESWTPIKDGGPADLVAVDLKRTWSVQPDSFASKSTNSSFLGRELSGVILLTLQDGRVAWSDPSVVPSGRPQVTVSGARRPDRRLGRSQRLHAREARAA